MNTPRRRSFEKPPEEPDTDQPSYDSDDESSPRLEGDTDDDPGRDEVD